MIFEDRSDAGRFLAWSMARYQRELPVVLGVAAGGVVVAREVARALGVPLDALVAHPLAAPDDPRVTVGAVAEGAAVLTVDAAARAGLDAAALAAWVARERAEVARRAARLRRGAAPLLVRGRTVLLVDDGGATGGVVRASLRSLRAWGASRCVLATAVATAGVAAGAQAEGAELYALASPAHLGALAFWYRDLPPVADGAVTALLDRAPRTFEPRDAPRGEGAGLEVGAGGLQRSERVDFIAS